METRETIRTIEKRESNRRSRNVEQYASDPRGAMNRIAGKVAIITRAMISDRGEVDLVAMFLPDGATGWDVMISAAWASANRGAAIEYVTAKLHSKLTKIERLQISSVVVVEQVTALLAARFGEIPLKEEPTIRSDFECDDILVREAYFIILRAPPLRKRRPAAH